MATITLTQGKVAYVDEEDVALVSAAYNNAAIELHGEFARLNQVCSRGK